jgi:hypothetical protein
LPLAFPSSHRISSDFSSTPPICGVPVRRWGGYNIERYGWEVVTMGKKKGKNLFKKLARLVR